MNRHIRTTTASLVAVIAASLAAGPASAAPGASSATPQATTAMSLVSEATMVKTATPKTLTVKQLKNKRLNPGLYRVVAQLPDRGQTDAVDLEFRVTLRGTVQPSGSKVLFSNGTRRGREYTLVESDLLNQVNRSTVTSVVAYDGQAKNVPTTLTVVRITVRDGGVKGGPHAVANVVGTAY